MPTLSLSILVLAIAGCSGSTSESKSPILSLSKQLVQFALQAGSNQTPNEKITVRNARGGTIGYTATSDAPWITITTSHGIDPDTIRITVFATGLASGLYVDTVVVTSSEADNSPQYVEVRFVINNALVVTPSDLSFSAVSNDQNPPPETLQVASLGITPLSISVSPSQSWLHVAPTTGTTPVAIEIAPDIAGLTNGIYDGIVTVTSAGATNSPINVSCSLKVTGWTAGNSIPSVDLADVFCTSLMTGFAVGYIGNNPEFIGTILKTIDGGKNWTINHTLAPATFGSVWFTDSQHGFVVGEKNAILTTVNGGASWSLYPKASLPLDTLYDFWEIQFVSNMEGWICGTRGVILHTTDGGANWSKQSSTLTLSLASIAKRSNQLLWIVGNNGSILTTVNGGTNWSIQTSGTSRDLWGVSFTDDLHGWIVGELGTLLKTTDGGNVWTPEATGIATQLHAIEMHNSGKGWIAGRDGTILYTENGGATWQAQVSGSGDWLFSIFFLDDSHGWVAGENGTVLRTLSAGR